MRFNRVSDARGKISKKKFIQLRIDFSSPEVSAKLFDLCDMDKSGLIDVKEFVIANAISLGTNIEEKLKASFRLYDTNGDRVLTKQEVIDTLYVFFLQQYKRDHNIPIYRQMELGDTEMRRLRHVVHQVFKKCDKDNNGTLDITEFVKGFAENKTVRRVLMQF